MMLYIKHWFCGKSGACVIKVIETNLSIYNKNNIRDHQSKVVEM